jgi:hypothetical protein
VTGGGGTAGGEQLLAGVVKSDELARNSMNQEHREQEQAIANSPRRIGAAKIGGGRRAATNGGRNFSVDDGKRKTATKSAKEGRKAFGYSKTDLETQH